MDRPENPMPKEELLEIEGPDLIRRGMTGSSAGVALAFL